MEALSAKVCKTQPDRMVCLVRDRSILDAWLMTFAFDASMFQAHEKVER